MCSSLDADQWQNKPLVCDMFLTPDIQEPVWKLLHFKRYRSHHKGAPVELLLALVETSLVVNRQCNKATLKEKDKTFVKRKKLKMSVDVYQLYVGVRCQG